MDTQLVIICLLTFVIHLVGTLAYSVRIAGVRTRRIAVSFALSQQLVVLNVAAVALWTVGVFAALYAGYLNPQFRVTASTLSSLVNGVATILMFVLIDPQLSVMTDDVVDGKLSEPCFRRAIVWLIGSRCVGTLVAQVLLVPAAALIVYVAERL